MSAKLLLIYVKKTKNIMAAVTMAAPPPGQVAVKDIAGDLLHVRYILDNTTLALVVSEVWIPAAELDVLAIDYDPLVLADVLANPHSYQLDSSNQPVIIPSIRTLKLSPQTGPGTSPITITFSPPETASGDVIWLGATSDDQEPKSVFISQVVTGPAPPAPIPSNNVVLPGSPVGNYTLLGLCSGYRPTMKEVTFT